LHSGGKLLKLWPIGAKCCSTAREWPLLKEEGTNTMTRFALAALLSFAVCSNVSATEDKKKKDDHHQTTDHDKKTHDSHDQHKTDDKKKKDH
jgi:hypothetical protein